MASSSSASLAEANLPCAGYLYPPEERLRLTVHHPLQPFGDSCYAAPFDFGEDSDDSSDDSDASVESYEKRKADEKREKKKKLNEDREKYEKHEASEIIASMSTEDFVFKKTPRKRRPENQTPEFAKTYLERGKGELAVLVVERGLSMSEELGAQVLLCKVQTSPRQLWKSMGVRNPPSKVVAKVFDPLYYPKKGPWSSSDYNDVAWMADKAFAQEAAAYLELHEHRKQNPIIDKFVPRFYGTFSITHTRPGPGSASRQVHVVLMEEIQGHTMFDMSGGRYEDDDVLVLEPPEAVGDKVALQVFSRVLHGLVAMEKFGVFHEDVNPRNVIVSLQPTTGVKQTKEPTLRRVVMVDFDVSRVFRYTPHKTAISQDLPKPVHPVMRFYLGNLASFVGWFPYEWLTECRERQITHWNHNEKNTQKQPAENKDYNIDDDERLLKWEKWAYKIMTREEFTMGNEANAIALARAARRDAEAKKVEELAKASEAQRNRARALSTDDIRRYMRDLFGDISGVVELAPAQSAALAAMMAKAERRAEAKRNAEAQATRSLKRRPASLDLSGTRGSEQNPVQPSTPTAASFSQTNTADPDVQQESPSKRQKTADLRAATASMTPVANVFGQMGLNTPANKATQEPDSPSQADGR